MADMMAPSDGWTCARSAVGELSLSEDRMLRWRKSVLLGATIKAQDVGPHSYGLIQGPTLKFSITCYDGLAVAHLLSGPHMDTVLPS